MTSSHNHIKKEIERQIGHIFLKYYNNEQDTRFEIIKQTSPPYPDLECIDARTGTILRLEITEFWEKNVDARDNYELIRGNITESELFKKKLAMLDPATGTGSDKERLMQILDKKLKKSYGGDNDIFLVIHDRSPFLDEKRVNHILSNLQLANIGPFKAIFFVLLIPWTYGEYKIFTVG